MCLQGRPLATVAKSLGLDDETAANEANDAALIREVWDRGIWQGEEEFDFAQAAHRLGIKEDQLRSKLAGTEEELALEALRQYHPTKALIYQACIAERQTQRGVGARLGLTPQTVSNHLTDARLIIAAFSAGLWEGSSPFSFRGTAKQLGMTWQALRRQLADLAAEERECDFCHKRYTPSWRPDAKSFCSENCRHAQAKEQLANTGPCPGCGAVILKSSMACAQHYRLLKQLKPCQRCGDDFACKPGTRTLYCDHCLPLMKRDWTRNYRARCRDREAREQAADSGRVISMDEARRTRKMRQTWTQLALPLDVDEPVRRRRVK